MSWTSKVSASSRCAPLSSAVAAKKGSWEKAQLVELIHDTKTGGGAPAGVIQLGQ